MLEKTPGVYVREIKKLPPSVPLVGTAIPAFIGHTERARFKGGSLLNEPTPITSLLEYEERFGGEPPIGLDPIELDAQNNLVPTTVEPAYYLYDSLRLFFNNGGGKCYIVSVGNYKDNVAQPLIEKGLEKLKEEDEPTLILFPDAVKLNPAELGSLQSSALSQCEELKDRFVICDVKDTRNAVTDSQAFRDSIGSKNLKYGAAYYPYLKSNLPRDIKYRYIRGRVNKFATPINWKDYTDDITVKAIIDELNSLVTDSTSLENTRETFINGQGVDNLKDGYESKVIAFKTAITDEEGEATVRGRFIGLMDYVYDAVHTILDQVVKAGGASNPLRTIMTDIIDGYMKIEIEKLVALDNSAKDKVNGTYFPRWNKGGRTWEYAGWTGSFIDTTDNDGVYPKAGADAAEKIENMATVERMITDIFGHLDNGVNAIFEEMAIVEDQKETSFREQIPIVKDLFAQLNSTNSIIPPSGAVAGVYAAIDRTRGVWKAPANVSLTSVTAPSIKIQNVQQDDLNVNVDAGKSINAIRSFSGNGVLIWGARTLAGNDKEWKYISVRRFFNMAEESLKKATSWVVFEPNNANTWIRIKAQIENMLTGLWRQGALVGDVPEEAFVVGVGLNVTMSEDDLLNGILNIEVGLRVSRPAEFVFLKFSHKTEQQ